MEISLSIASFPLDSETIEDLRKLLQNSEQADSRILVESNWQQDDVKGFAVLAYTEDSELLGVAAAIDFIGLDSYEWSAFVDLRFRRLTIGSALAGGVEYGLQQRQAVGELAVFTGDDGAEAFLSSLGYEPDFKEIKLVAEPLTEFALPETTTVTPYQGQEEALENLMAAAFGEEVLPVVHYNIEQADRDIFMMISRGMLVASATLIKEEGGSNLWINSLAVGPGEQGKGYGRTFLLWCRHYAVLQGKSRIFLEVETENEALNVYRKSGFTPVHTVNYWRKA